MIEMTATDLRKDLFRILDRMAETGETLRVTRKGKVLNFTAQPLEDPEADARQKRFDAYMALGPREGWEERDVDPSDKSHWEYDPEKKFKDLEWP